MTILRALRDRPLPEALPAGYRYKAVPARIRLAADGRYLGVVESVGEGRAVRGTVLAAPDRKRSGRNAPPVLLVDGPDYLFGRPQPGRQNAEAVALRFAGEFRAQLRRCHAATADEAIDAVLSFLRATDEDQGFRTEVLAELDRLKLSDPITFSVADELVIDRPAVQRFWAEETGAASVPGRVGSCTVCGTRSHIPEMWPVAIKGIPGGQTSGMQLVSFDKGAFESYRQPRATGALTCWSCADHIARSLNALLDDPASSYRVGNAVHVFWVTGGDGAFNPFNPLNDPQPEEIRSLLQAPRSARVSALEARLGLFHSIHLSASGSRAVIRGAIDVPVAAVRENLARFFARQAITDGRHEAPPVKLYALLMGCVREAKDLPPSWATALVGHALQGTPLPLALASAVTRRVRADGRGVTHPQAALLKLCLLDPLEDPEHMTSVDTGHPDPAYHCGRLLAAIDAIQYRASGNVNSTLADRFFGAASASPATCFGPLLRTSRNHLSKLRAAAIGASLWHENHMAEIMQSIPEFPKTLSLRDQALFCLGFYHERADARAKTHASKAPVPREATDIDNEENPT